MKYIYIILSISLFFIGCDSAHTPPYTSDSTIDNNKSSDPAVDITTQANRVIRGYYYPSLDTDLFTDIGNISIGGGGKYRLTLDNSNLNCQTYMFIQVEKNGNPLFDVFTDGDPISGPQSYSWTNHLAGTSGTENSGNITFNLDAFVQPNDIINMDFYRAYPVSNANGSQSCELYFEEVGVVKQTGI